MKKLSLIILSGLLIASLSGCGTMKGLGSDISSIGKAISGGSDNVKESIRNKNN